MNKSPYFFKAFWHVLRGVKMYKINIEWCSEGKVFIATSDDIDGLILEADDIPQMLEHLKDVVPMLLEANGHTSAPRDFDFSINIKGHFSELLDPRAYA